MEDYSYRHHPDQNKTDLELYKMVKSQTNLELDELEFLKLNLEKELNMYLFSDKEKRESAEGIIITNFSLEIALLRRKINIVNNFIETQKEKADFEYLNTKQKVLIFHYLFKHLKIDDFTNLKGQKRLNTEFILKVLGLKGIDNYKDSYTHKILKYPLNEVKRDDLQEIRNLFESVGLNEIAEYITKDLKV